MTSSAVTQKTPCVAMYSFPGVKKNKKVFKKVSLEIRTLEKQKNLQSVRCTICNYICTHIIYKCYIHII